MKRKKKHPKPLSHHTLNHLCLLQLTLHQLEELNDILSKGELEVDTYLDSIIYQCEILIDYTK